MTDCAYLWTGVNKRVRRPRHIYEEAHGKIPKGYVIYHKDGDKHNDDIDNLISVSRAKMLELNRNKNGKTK